MTSLPEVVISPARFEGAIFDLDGVLSDTTAVHSAAWKSVFDDYLQRRSREVGEAFQPFDATADYLAYVDGRSRKDGVRQFLASRSIQIPDRSPDEAVETVESLAARKDALVQAGLREGSKALPGAEATLRALKDAGVRVAVASSSANCALVLAVTGLEFFVDARVDGVLAAEMGLPSKPDPALFLEAARRLGVTPDRAILFEDALPGVEAGRRGGFRCVVGMDRGDQAAELRAEGADVVLRDLTQVRVEA